MTNNRKLTLCLALLAVAVIGISVAQTGKAPALYYEAQSVERVMADSLAQRGSMGVGNIQNGEDFRINLIERTGAAGPIVHEEGTELHYITAGAGTLMTGGTVLRSADGDRARIEGGLARRVQVGDAILIPAGTPHQYTAVENSVTYLEVRFETSEY